MYAVFQTVDRSWPKGERGAEHVAARASLPRAYDVRQVEPDLRTRVVGLAGRTDGAVWRHDKHSASWRAGKLYLLIDFARVDAYHPGWPGEIEIATGSWVQVVENYRRVTEQTWYFGEVFLAVGLFERPPSDELVRLRASRTYDLRTRRFRKPSADAT